MKKVYPGGLVVWIPPYTKAEIDEIYRKGLNGTPIKAPSRSLTVGRSDGPGPKETTTDEAGDDREGDAGG